MPFTTSRSFVAARRLDDHGRADLQVVVLGVAVVDERAVAAEVGEDRLRALLPLERQNLPLSGSTAVRNSVLSKMRASAVRTLAIASTPGASAAASAALVGIGLKLFCDGDRVVGGEDVVDRALEARDEPGREQRHERDERQADHQRRRGRRRPLRVAARVLRREPIHRSGRAARPGTRAASRAPSSTRHDAAPSRGRSRRRNGFRTAPSTNAPTRRPVEPGPNAP